MKFLYIDMRT